MSTTVSAQRLPLSAQAARHIVQGDIVVQSGATLTIQPGTTVLFASTDAMGAGLDNQKVEMTIRDTLSALGTAAAPIVLAAQSGSGSGLWDGVIVEDASAAFQTRALTVKNATYGLYIRGCSPSINGVTLRLASLETAVEANGPSDADSCAPPIAIHSRGGKGREPLPETKAPSRD